MFKLPTFCAALAASAMTLTATVKASEPMTFSFRVQQEANDRVRADFRRLASDRHQWNSTFRNADLAGLDRTLLNAPGSSPLRFAVVREAGRLDCAGSGGHGVATGSCRFTADQGFFNYLRSSGVTGISGEDAFTMTAVGVRRDLVSTIRQASFPVPNAHDLVALTALGVDRGYIGELSAAGYRPSSIDKLIEFKALGITPEYVAGFQRIGLGRLPAGELVQFKALGVTPEYVVAFRNLGYGTLSPDTLVEFRALGVTPDYVADLKRRGFHLPPGKIVQMKALGISPRDVAAADRD